LLGIVLKMAAYIAVAFVIAWFVLPVVINWASEQPYLAQSHGIAILALMLVMLFAWSAEAFGGVATITGSFIAGVGLSRVRHQAKQEIEEAISHLAYVIFVPIFFIDVGLTTNLRLFPLSALPFALILLAVAVVAKIGGCGWGALLGGFNREESIRLGVCMVARGEVGLIIASLGLTIGVFRSDDPLFSALFLVILVTTLVTPFLVRMIFPRQPTMAKG
jgi:Kef-type K+ transport system membrane component KefB